MAVAPLGASSSACCGGVLALLVDVDVHTTGAPGGLLPRALCTRRVFSASAVATLAHTATALVFPLTNHRRSGGQAARNRKLPKTRAPRKPAKTVWRRLKPCCRRSYSQSSRRMKCRTIAGPRLSLGSALGGTRLIWDGDVGGLPAKPVKHGEGHTEPPNAAARSACPGHSLARWPPCGCCTKTSYASNMAALIHLCARVLANEPTLVTSALFAAEGRLAFSNPLFQVTARRGRTAGQKLPMLCRHRRVQEHPKLKP
jgi:hypothetical protein